MRSTFALVLALALLASCTGDSTTTSQAPTTDSTDTSTTVGEATTTTEPIPTVDRIGIRIVEDRAEFFDTGTGQKFVPRGVNFVDFKEHPSIEFAFTDSVFATNTYDPARVTQAFEDLTAIGYNTVRIFFDTCGSEQHCIGNPDGQGLNPEYLDNMVDVMRIAARTGIRVLLTANSLPDQGGYWERFFDPAFAAGHDGFERRENADWLHRGGIDAKEAFWNDLMSGLAERNAPFEVVLGWQLTNEWWLFKDIAPLSLDEGMVEAGDGKTYDMAAPGAKEEMIVATTVHYIDRMRAVIDRYDPESLVTMGFFAPLVEGPDWFVITEPFLTRADLDFFDFHAYHDDSPTIDEYAASFGMTGYESKPIVMGETGSGHGIVPSALQAASRSRQWYAESCQVGFDGWLNWGYYPWPDSQLGSPWTFLDSDGLLMDLLAPANHPDPCSNPDDSLKPHSEGAAARASRESPGQPAGLVLDGRHDAWNAGDFPPQWIEIDIADGSTVGSIHLTSDQWPWGISRYRIIATLGDGSDVLLADVTRVLANDVIYSTVLSAPVPDVTRVRVETLSGPSWVAWREISIDPPIGDETRPACLVATAALFSEPDPGATEIGTPPTDFVAVDGYLETDPGWLRVSGDLWTISDATACPALPPVPGDELDLVSVTFNVTVPSPGPSEVFVVGLFGDEMPPFHDVGMFIGPDGSTERSIEVLLPRGYEIRYFYTRGGFGTIERPDSCGEFDPRRAVATDGLVINDTVVKWEDLDC